MFSPKKKFGVWASFLIVLTLLLSPVVFVVSTVILLASFSAKDTEAKCDSPQTNTFFLPSDTSLGKSPKFEAYQRRFDTYPNADEVKAQQREIVKIIIGVAKSRGLGDYDIRLGLATAMQESDLQNLNKGHLDSKGVVQQRPSQGWGTIEQVTDPVYAMNKFYSEAEKITNREQLPLIETAMRVQKPDAAAYRARWEWDPIVAELATAEANASPIGAIAKQVVIPKVAECNDVKTTTMLAVDGAQSKLNQPYDWKDPKGFDGSGLTSWAYQIAGKSLPADAEEQFKVGDPVEKSDLLPGDLVFWAKDPADQKTIDAVALWMGSDKILEAEDVEQTIQIVPMKWDGFAGAKRPIPKPQLINSTDGDTATGKWHSPLKLGSYEKSSPYSMRVNPITGVLELHNGVDLSAPGGTPIYSVSDGTVTSTEWQEGVGGNVTFIKDGEGHTFGYAHQQSRAPNIKVGAKVVAGDLIGYVGSTGGSTGNHLHFMVMTNNGNGVQFAEPVQFMRERGILL